MDKRPSLTKSKSQPTQSSEVIPSALSATENLLCIKRTAEFLKVPEKEVENIVNQRKSPRKSPRKSSRKSSEKSPRKSSEKNPRKSPEKSPRKIQKIDLTGSRKSYKSPERIRFKFHGRDEALQVVDTGGNLVEYLVGQKNECPLIGSQIKFLKILGQGSAGAPAWVITIPGMGSKEFVAKVFTKDNWKQQVEKNATLSGIAHNLSKQYMIPPKTIVDLNGGDSWKMIKRGDFIYIPAYAKTCKLTENHQYPRFDGAGSITIRKGSYLCENEMYSEYIIGVLCANLYRTKCINFVDMFGFTTCNDHNPAEPTKQYIFMQKITGSIKKMYESGDNTLNRRIKYGGVDVVILDVLYLQTLFAIVCYQSYLGIQHNDLHADNVFYELITPDTEYKGAKLIEYNVLNYNIGGTNIYLPNVGYIAKIADFGLSVKYTHPIIGNKESVETGYAQPSGGGAWMPNWYSINYDFLVITYALSVYKTPLVTHVMDLITTRNGGYSFINPETGRPFMQMLDPLRFINPYEFLKSPMITNTFRLVDDNYLSVGIAP